MKVRTGAWTDEKSTVMGILEPSSTLSPMMDNAKSEYGKNRNPLSQSLAAAQGEVMFKFVVVGAWNPIDCRCSTVGRGHTAWNGSSDGSQRPGTKKQSNFRPHSPQCAAFSDWKRPP